MTDPSPVHILGLAGSLRHASYNRALLRACGEMLPPGVTLTVFDLKPVGMYDGDDEAAGMPAPVAALREAIVACDGVLIASPEYNAGVSPVIKNAIDWASRPPAGVLNDKPVALVGATPGLLGTARAQMALRATLANVGMLAMVQPQVMIPSCGPRFAADGTLTDATTREMVAKALVAFAHWVRRLRGEAK